MRHPGRAAARPQIPNTGAQAQVVYRTLSTGPVFTQFTRLPSPPIQAHSKPAPASAFRLQANLFWR